MSDLNNIRLSFNQKITAVNSKDSLQILKTEFFGKNGLITSQFKNLATIPQDKRKEFASDLNNLKNDLNDQLEKKQLDLNRS
jgi:phenylalanyl-tRNA synthetase alpha chain